MFSFKFKQFTIEQGRSSHKVGTDGTLLGAWANVNGVERILEIGTGTGLISLMLAQRTSENALIDAVEIEGDDVAQARENVLHSPWPEKIVLHHCPIQQFKTTTAYDLIITNPPYFINSFLSPQKKRSQARHTGTLSFEEILQISAGVLTEEGRLAVILPVVEAERFISASRFHFFNVRRKCQVRSRSHKPVERVLFELHRLKTETVEEELIIHADGNEWSEDYKALTKAFYLKL